MHFSVHILGQIQKSNITFLRLRNSKPLRSHKKNRHRFAQGERLAVLFLWILKGKRSVFKRNPVKNNFKTVLRNLDINLNRLSAVVAEQLKNK